MKKIMIIVVAAVLAGGGWYFFRNKKSSDSPSYMQATAELQDLSETVDTTGVVEPENRVEIQPSSAGRIEEILVEEGDKIKAGEVLALMSSSDRVAILDAARATSEEEYDKWKETYKPIKVISPIDGTVILKNIVEGQTVSASTVLFAMSDRLIISASLDESDIGRIKKGQRATIVLDSYPDKTVRGTVFKILDEGTTSNNVVTYTVKIRPERVPSFFRSQMTANIKVRVSDRSGVLLIPTTAVVTDPQGETAVIKGFGRDGRPVYTAVETGQNEGESVEITSGLKDGDVIYYGNGGYVQQNSGEEESNPLMPKRPKMSSQQRRAMRGR